jgi:small subunit ribosomal protein S9
MIVTKSTDKYFEAVGRRKTAIARVRLFPEAKTRYEINDRALEAYFPTRQLQLTATESMTDSKTGEKYYVSIKVKGGGIAAQADAIRLGIARALLEHNGDLRIRLKKLGYLKRDPRAKERRKFGLKKARKSPQWSKR